MSDTKLQKYLTKYSTTVPPNPLPFTPALLAASKGKDLELEAVRANNPCQIKFWCKRGATIQKELLWLQGNLHRKVAKHKNILLFIWLGTCDLTQKQGKTKFIALRDKNVERATNNIILQLRDLLQEVHRFPSIQPVFLENPIYSIVAYNKAKGHLHPEIYLDEDPILIQQVESLNSKIKILNTELGHRPTISPQFSQDLEQRRKDKGGKVRNYFNLKLFRDGLHPDVLLATVWLRKIENRILDAAKVSDTNKC